MLVAGSSNCLLSRQTFRKKFEFGMRNENAAVETNLCAELFKFRMILSDIKTQFYANNIPIFERNE